MEHAAIDLGDANLPPHLIEDLRAFFDEHRPPCHFLQAALKNDLYDTFRTGDGPNRAVIPRLVAFLYETGNVPRDAFGSVDAYNSWIG